jgi:hypothetical protein
MTATAVAPLKRTCTKYNTAAAEEILERLAAGESLKAICRTSETLPSESTVREWALRNQGGDFAERFQRAREIGAWRMADEILEIADEAATDLGAIARARLKIDARKWLACKILPRVFGDKLSTEVSGPDGAPITLGALVAASMKITTQDKEDS